MSTETQIPRRVLINKSRNKTEHTFILQKGKVLPRTSHEGLEGKKRYTSTLSLTSVLDEGGWSTPRPGRFTPGKETRYTLYRRLGGPHGRSGRLRKIPPPPGFDPRTVQPLASRYIDRAIAALHPAKQNLIFQEQRTGYSKCSQAAVAATEHLRNSKRYSSQHVSSIPLLLLQHKLQVYQYISVIY
jgi:hypothetical protein